MDEKNVTKKGYVKKIKTIPENRICILCKIEKNTEKDFYKTYGKYIQPRCKDCIKLKYTPVVTRKKRVIKEIPLQPKEKPKKIPKIKTKINIKFDFIKSNCDIGNKYYLDNDKLTPLYTLAKELLENNQDILNLIKEICANQNS